MCTLQWKSRERQVAENDLSRSAQLLAVTAVQLQLLLLLLRHHHHRRHRRSHSMTSVIRRRGLVAVAVL